MTDSRFQQALDYIYSFIDYETQRKPHDAPNYDLRRVDELLAYLGNPHWKMKCVHVAGSKGKGSVSAMVASVLVSAGYKTGLYTSPHLLVFNERIRVNGALVSDDEVVALLDHIKPAIDAVNQKATYGRLTTFEIITAMGFAHFAGQGCDFGVIEVGLGGRLDATNVIVPEVSVITSISLEHTDLLGDTLAKIAAEKAGIIKPGVTVVSAPQDSEVDAVLEATCRRQGAPLVRAAVDVAWQGLGYDSERQSLRVVGRLRSYDLTIPLLGEYQLENTATAVAALEVLIDRGHHIPLKAMVDGMASVQWPGRMQVLMRRPFVVADGAHNPYSAARLREALKKHFTYRRATLIIGTSSDKDIAGIADELAPMFDRVIVTRSIHPRSLETSPLVAQFARHGLAAEATSDISEALPMALSRSGEDDLICIAGSLFVVAGAIDFVNASGPRSSPAQG